MPRYHERRPAYWTGRQLAAAILVVAMLAAFVACLLVDWT
jgi:hypothetical protein